MLHTRVIVTGFSEGGSSQTFDRGAKFRNKADIERVIEKAKKDLGSFFSYKIVVDTREAD